MTTKQKRLIIVNISTGTETRVTAETYLDKNGSPAIVTTDDFDRAAQNNCNDGISAVFDEEGFFYTYVAR